MLNKINLIIISMRPKQWIKNLIIFSSLVFSNNLFSPLLFFKTFMIFIFFTLLCSGVYIINDIKDIENDKKHPNKAKRPITSGKLNIRFAFISAVLFILTALIGSFLVSPYLLLILFIYLCIQIVYTLLLKTVVIIELLCIATGFMLRIIAGAVVIKVFISSWITICTIFLALFLILGKRRNELIILGADSVEHRKILNEYTTVLLDQMLAITSSGVLLSYSLYAMAPETITRFGRYEMCYTIPFVLYGIFRYMYLIYKQGQGGSPEEIIFADKSLIINVLFYIIIVIWVVYF